MKPSTHSTLPSGTGDDSPRQRHRPRTVDFLRLLANRGLRGVKLVIADAHLHAVPRPDRFVRPRPDPPDAGPGAPGRPPPSRRNRSDGHGTDARRRPPRHRDLPAAERRGFGSRDLLAHALQLQPAAGAEPGAPERAAQVRPRRDRTRLRLRGPERARQVLLRGRLGDPRPAAHGRLRRADLDRRPAVVQRQGRHARLLFDRRVADGPGGDAPSRPRRRRADGPGRGNRPHGTVPRAGELLPRRRAPASDGRLALRRAEHPAPDLPAGHQSRGPGTARDLLRSGGEDLRTVLRGLQRAFEPS